MLLGLDTSRQLCDCPVGDLPTRVGQVPDHADADDEEQLKERTELLLVLDEFGVSECKLLKKGNYEGDFD
jgi:hypothetical protein